MAKDNDDFLIIDEHSLDKEWVEQPRLSFKYSEKLADAQLALDEAEDELSIVAAELDKSIRASPEDYEIDKVTEPAIKAAIPLQEEHRTALATIRTCKHRVNILKGANKAIDHRKRALENLVDLYGQNYFSSPRAPDGAKEAMEEVEEKAIRKRGQKKRRRKEDEDDDE